MQACEVPGCPASGTETVQLRLPGWRVAETRRVCDRHKKLFDADLDPQRQEKPVTTARPNPQTAMPDCVIPECEKPQKTRGLCHGHYEQHRRMGTVDQVGLPKRPGGRPAAKQKAAPTTARQKRPDAIKPPVDPPMTTEPASSDATALSPIEPVSQGLTEDDRREIEDSIRDRASALELLEALPADPMEMFNQSSDTVPTEAALVLRRILNPNTIDLSKAEQSVRDAIARRLVYGFADALRGLRLTVYGGDIVISVGRGDHASS